MSEIVSEQNIGQDVAYASFNSLFRAVEKSYPSLSKKQFVNAVTQTQLFNSFSANPWTQNDRVKSISTLPHSYGKNDIVEFLLSPNSSERPLREVSNSLVWTAYPFFKLIKTTADILTYRNYTHPKYIETEDAKSKELMREWRLVEKIKDEINPEQSAHEATMMAMRDGKVFYYLRKSIDRSHNSVNYCFLQQLPQDWLKIVGYNNISKYTIAFDMMYFLKPGTSINQFGSLFLPYARDFFDVVEPEFGERRKGKSTVVFSSMATRAQELMKRNAVGNPDIYYQNGQWFYWVTLPADAVWTFEIDDSARDVISPLAGLILSMAQISQYENLQLELLANPLVALLHGEIEYQDNVSSQMEDAYKLSPSGRQFFEALWYQMMYQNNTGGIGFYAAPLKNMKLEQLAEAPNAQNISSEGYAYTMMKSGNGLLPLSTEPRAGMVEYAAKIESQYGAPIYRTFERMMNHLYSDIGLKYNWQFKMFGNVFSEKAELEDARKGMTLGILIDTLRYDALMGHSILDDIAVSEAVVASGVLDKRIPLVNSYSMKQGDSNLPPRAQTSLPPQAQVEEGGRPTSEMGDGDKTEGQEASIDAGE